MKGSLAKVVAGVRLCMCLQILICADLHANTHTHTHTHTTHATNTQTQTQTGTHTQVRTHKHVCCARASGGTFAGAVREGENQGHKAGLTSTEAISRYFTTSTTPLRAAANRRVDWGIAKTETSAAYSGIRSCRSQNGLLCNCHVYSLGSCKCVSLCVLTHPRVYAFAQTYAQTRRRARAHPERHRVHSHTPTCIGEPNGTTIAEAFAP